MDRAIAPREAYAAFEAAAGRLDRELVSFAFRLLGRDEAARDCVQDAFLKAYSAIAGGARPENVRPWLYRLVYHAAVDRLRRSSIEERALGRIEAADAAKDEPSGRFEQLISTLPSPYREIIYLRYAGDFTYAEMEAVLGTPAATLRVSAARALERLQRKLKEGSHGL